MNYYWRRNNKDNIGDRVQDGFDKQEIINTDLMFMDNIKNNSAYEFNPSSKEPTPIPILDDKGFDETQSDANDPIWKFSKLDTG